MPHNKSHPSTVFVNRVPKHDVPAAMKRLLSSMPFPAHAQSIGIKLNLCDYRKPETGAVSDPDVVEPLLAELRSRYPNSDIFVYEHDANSTLAKTLFGYTGLDGVANKYDTRCVSLADEEWVTRPLNGLYFRRLEVPLLLERCNLLINHPKLKTHGRTLMTCGLKNMFGCIRPKKKVQFHKHLAEAIVDINRLIPSHLTIVDANLCLEGNRGPTQGIPKRLGLLFGGSDIVAVDAFGADVMGFGARHIRHIRLAERAGLGTLAYDVEGDWHRWDAAQSKFQFSMWKFRMMQLARRLLA